MFDSNGDSGPPCGVPCVRGLLILHFGKNIRINHPFCESSVVPMEEDHADAEKAAAILGELV